MMTTLLCIVFDSVHNRFQRKLLERVTFTRKELQVIALIWKGYNNFDISEELHVSVRSVERHRSTILRKTQAKSIVGAIRFCVEKGVLQPGMAR